MCGCRGFLTCIISYSEARVFTRKQTKSSREKWVWFTVIDTQTGLTGADETNFLSFLLPLCFVEMRYIPLQSSYGSEMCRKPERATANAAADLQTPSSGGTTFPRSRYIAEHKCHFDEPGLYFDACFHLNTHISSPLAQRAAEAASRRKIWLYHQVSIPAGPLRCLLLILQTGVGGLKLLLQWISPPLFLFVRKTSVLRSAVSACLSVPCLCCVEAWILGFHKRFIHLPLALKPFISALYLWYIC